MDAFPRVFLLVFAQLAVGGLLTLSIPPFHGVARGFYKSTAVVFVGLGGLVLLGRLALQWELGTLPASEALELGLWTAFVLGGAGYVATLWGEPVVVRARLYALTWASGGAALLVAAWRYSPGGVVSVETLVYPLAFLVPALVMGTMAGGMLLGHWYLIELDLSLEPFRRILAFGAASVLASATVLVGGTALLAAFGTAPTQAGLTRLLDGHLPLLAGRVLAEPIGTWILVWMIWRTLQIPQTMAATGLYYVAILFAVVGAFLGRFLLFRTGLPL